MHALRNLMQSLHGRNGLRALILVIYAALTFNFYTSAAPTGIFMGMFRMSSDPGTPNLMANVYSLGYMICGMALPLERFSEYLSMPDSMVYVRRRRGGAQFARYLALNVVYCCVFTLAQTAVAFAVSPQIHWIQLLSTSVCAAWMLLCLLLIANCGYLLSVRGAGYAASVGAYALLLSIGSAAQWFASGWWGPVPAWSLTLLVCTGILCLLNLMVFDRVQIL
ncbi:MAG: hypothetical protein LKI88_01505 [Bifidobacterium sp.]|jgi:hypothetical protein|nr:hypothetical protein [Bifidobacterium sp.]MCI1864601.1 hypothetical protein [Bifidobacterium sp.]